MMMGIWSGRVNLCELLIEPHYLAEHVLPVIHQIGKASDDDRYSRLPSMYDMIYKVNFTESRITGVQRPQYQHERSFCNQGIMKMGFGRRKGHQQASKDHFRVYRWMGREFKTEAGATMTRCALSALFRMNKAMSFRDQQALSDACDSEYP